MITLKGNNAIYQGESTDEKPENVPANTLFENLTRGINIISRVKRGLRLGV